MTSIPFFPVPTPCNVAKNSELDCSETGSPTDGIPTRGDQYTMETKIVEEDNAGT